MLSVLVGAVVGALLSLILIYVINVQSFGWTIQFHWPVAFLVSALGLVYASSVLAGLYPARVAARLNPIEAVHEE
jgi:putative ABC transport system permease protein